MLSFDQSEEDNKLEFINRLVESGWDRQKAREEWENIQKDEWENIQKEEETD